MNPRKKTRNGKRREPSHAARALFSRSFLVRVSVLLPVIVAGFALFPRSFGLESSRIRVGERAPRTVIAEFGFPVLKDPQQLEQERTDTASKSPIALVRDDSVSTRVFRELGRFRSMIHRLREGTAGEAASPRMELSQALLVWLMLNEDPDPILNQAEAILQETLDRGLVDGEVEPLLRNVTEVHVEDAVGSRRIATDRIQTPSHLREATRNYALSRGIEVEPIEELVMRFARANLFYDAEETEQIRSAAREGVDPVALRVHRGERIVEAREKVTPEILRKLASYDEWRRQRESGTEWDRAGEWIGRFLLLLVGVGAFVAYLRFLRGDLYQSTSDLSLLALTCSLVMAVTALLLHLLDLSPLMAPVAAAPILITLLYDERLALVVGLGLTGLIGLLTESGVGVVAVLGVGAVTSVFCVRGLRQRKQFYRLLAFVPAVQMLTLAGLALAHRQPLPDLLRDGLSVVANPILSAGLAIFLIPLAEHGFRKCSDITLLEFSDLNRPLLRRLMVEAPGTYHHCLMVGTLAEAGARVSHANPLLARVIGYYHDVGKVTKPEYFIENIGSGRKNPHDRLTPSMSRLILESHVREGAALARADRLPHIVVEGIRQHHGGSLMTFFWMKAKKIDPQAQEDDFRYPGPGPSFREAALVMLADQVDAAARALEDPTPSRIKGVVLKVLETRLAEGNLDKSDLSLSDLARVRDAFVPILAAFFHSRAIYVSTEDDAKRTSTHRDREQTAKDPTLPA